eukprot:COSAG02_NODE_2261_length_9322_cov_152.037298_11_plen_52_part_00
MTGSRHAVGTSRCEVREQGVLARAPVQGRRVVRAPAPPNYQRASDTGHKAL